VIRFPGEPANHRIEIPGALRTDPLSPSPRLSEKALHIFHRPPDFIIALNSVLFQTGGMIMKGLLVIAIIFTFGAAIGYAGDTASHGITLSVTDVCRIHLNSASEIKLALSAPAAGGSAPEAKTDAGKALRYTSIVPSGGSRKITVNWGPADSAPAGTALYLSVANLPAGSGLATGRKKLSGKPQDLIVNIRSCVTGGACGQAQLSYSFQIADVTGLISDDARKLTVSFTLTDAS
jgi:hypothetical protein